jgi:hypothetical protein
VPEANRLFAAPLPAISLAVVGADYPNRRGPGRRFEIELCKPGDPVELRPEPKNPKDPRAIAVFSERGVQIGYLTAERCGRIGQLMSEGRELRSIFQEKTRSGAIIRVAFDGGEPQLPPSRSAADEPGWDPDFYPDEEPPEDIGCD